MLLVWLGLSVLLAGLLTVAVKRNRRNRRVRELYRARQHVDEIYRTARAQMYRYAGRPYSGWRDML